MRQRRQLTLAFAASCVGCSDPTISKTEATRAADALALGIEETAQLYGQLVNPSAADMPCTALSGDTTDVDLDTIPASAELMCYWPARLLGYTGTLSGTMMVTDDAPDVPGWGFTASADMKVTLAAPGGGEIRRDWDGMITATEGTGLEQHRVLHAVSEFPAIDVYPDTTVIEDNDWAITFASRRLTVTGTSKLTVNGADAKTTVDTPTPLTYSLTCATRIIGGRAAALYYDADGEHSIFVDWSDCDRREVSWTTVPGRTPP